MPRDVFKGVRVRFAPSPTGPLHIGGVRTALFNYLFARQAQGQFLIRLEDTDRERSEKKWEAEILDSLQWLGLEWDGEVRRQSDRLDLYRRVVKSLVDRGDAYVAREGDREAVKLRIRTPGVRFQDLVHGDIEFKSSELDDFVILKSDGYPTYHLASVVDDHDMGITHVVRGDDHISNTPRHLAIYDALKWSPPQFAHLPLVVGEDRTPLSKRHAAVSLSTYRLQGYLPDALINYLALLGWSSDDNREFFKRDELCREFSLSRINKTSACFDPEKLKWLNQEHIRRLPEEEYVARAKRFMGVDSPLDSQQVRNIALLYRDRIQTFGELGAQCAFFFAHELSFDPKAVEEHLSRLQTRTHLQGLKDALEREGNFGDAAALEALLRRTAEQMKVHARELIHPTRVAISGRSVTPGLFDVMVLLGKEAVLQRIQYAIIHFF